MAEWQEILDLAIKFASNCAEAYRSANDRTRQLYNKAVFEQILVKDGEIEGVTYRAPFNMVFGVEKFEQGSMERETGLEPATSTLGRLRSAR